MVVYEEGRVVLVLIVKGKIAWPVSKHLTPPYLSPRLREKANKRNRIEIQRFANSFQSYNILLQPKVKYEVDIFEMTLFF